MVDKNRSASLTERLRGSFRQIRREDAEESGRFSEDGILNGFTDKSKKSRIQKYFSVIPAMMDAKKAGDKLGVAACIVYLITLADFAVLILRYLLFSWGLNSFFIWSNPVYLILGGLLPFAAWCYGTELRDLNFRVPKVVFFYCFLFHAELIFVAPVLKFLADYYVPVLLAIPTDRIFNASMVLWFARYTIWLPVFLFFYIINRNILSSTSSDAFTREMKEFKLSYLVDLRPNKGNYYDLDIVDDMSTGQNVLIMEEDRFLASIADGATGTGKTAGINMRQWVRDLKQKKKNLANLEHELWQMIEDGEAVYVPAEGRAFRSSDVVPYPKFRKKYTRLLEKYRDASLIMVAPDEETTDMAMDYAIAHGFQPRYVDATANEYQDSRRYEKYRTYLTGMNVLYVPMGLSLPVESLRASEAANNLAEMLDGVDRARGGSSGDRFFTEENNAMTIAISLLCILYFRHRSPYVGTGSDVGPRQAVMSDVQDVVNDLTKIGDMLEEVYRHYGNPKTMEEGDLGIHMDRTNPYFNYITRLRKIAEDDKERQRHENFATGLVNIYNRFLQVNVKPIFCDPGVTSTIGEWFEDGEVIVVCNSSRLGNSGQLSLGLGFQLNLTAAIFRRDLDQKDYFPLIIETIDEVPILLSGEAVWCDRLLSIGRKYKLALTMCLQSVNQLKKNKEMEYISGLFQQTGTLYVFTRAPKDDIRLFSELSGVKYTDTVKQSLRNTSLLDENASTAVTESYSSEEAQRFSENDVRFGEFGSFHVITSRQGTVLPAIHGKINFVDKKAELNAVPFEHINWARVAERHRLTEEDRAMADEAMSRLMQPSVSLISAYAEADQYSRAPIGSIGVRSVTAADRSPVSVDPDETEELFTLPSSEGTAKKASVPQSGGLTQNTTANVPQNTAANVPATSPENTENGDSGVPFGFGDEI